MINEDRELVSCSVLPTMNKQDGTPGREGKGAFFWQGRLGVWGALGQGSRVKDMHAHSLPSQTCSRKRGRHSELSTIAQVLQRAIGRLG